MTTPMIIAGIDPASQTGIAILDADPTALRYAARVRVREGDQWVASAVDMADVIRAHGTDILVIEQQHISRQGHAGAIIPAQVMGYWLAVAQLAGCDAAIVQPSQWQGHYRIKRNGKTKQQGRALARSIFGAVADKEDLADAALIAAWARTQQCLPLVWAMEETT